MGWTRREKKYLKRRVQVGCVCVKGVISQVWFLDDLLCLGVDFGMRSLLELSINLHRQTTLSAFSFHFPLLLLSLSLAYACAPFLRPGKVCRGQTGIKSSRGVRCVRWMMEGVLYARVGISFCPLPSLLLSLRSTSSSTSSFYYTPTPLCCLPPSNVTPRIFTVLFQKGETGGAGWAPAAAHQQRYASKGYRKRISILGSTLLTSAMAQQGSS